MESSPAWIGIAIIVLVHVVSTVWWASKVSTLLDVVQRDLNLVMVEFKLSRNIYITKEESASIAALQQKEMSAVWKKLDKLPEKCPMEEK